MHIFIWTKIIVKICTYKNTGNLKISFALMWTLEIHILFALVRTLSFALALRSHCVYSFAEEEYLKDRYKDDHRALENGALIISKWFQPLRSFKSKDVFHKLDKIALKVKERILSEHPGHPIAQKLPEEGRCKNCDLSG